MEKEYVEGVRTPRAPEIVAMAKSLDVTLESLIENRRRANAIMRSTGLQLARTKTPHSI